MHSLGPLPMKLFFFFFLLISPKSTHQMNKNNVERLKRANFMSRKSEKSKMDFMVSTKLSYQVYRKRKDI